jgi:5-methyltetrahydropteroyltriglutamate--homocysteine methyltransferase
MISTSTIGFPRIGPNREMKKSLEAFWKGQISEDILISNSDEIELSAWTEQAAAGVDLVALDGTLYDQVLDFAVMYLGLVPERFKVDCDGVVVMLGLRHASYEQPL